MHLIVGLGNPGAEYLGTRHNAGFEAVDLIASRHRIGPLRAQGKALVGRGDIEAHSAILCKPQTFMNLSGEAVGALVRYYKVAPEAVVVLHDELDFDVGRVRLKQGGGHGGHNGLRSISQHIGADYLRVRLGIGRPPNPARGIDWVLGRHDKEGRTFMDQACERAADAVVAILQGGIERAMNTFNSLP